MGLAREVYQLTRAFPPDERFGITAQLRRAAIAVPSDIAEGNIRSSRRDYLRFVDMARGTVAEIETQLILASELEMGRREDVEHALARTESLGRMLTRLRASLTD
jgi:carbamoyl-phosphate synthase large subunit